MFAQCAYHSKEHEAVIVSMGTGASCKPIWTASRNAIVSKTHPLHASLVHDYRSSSSSKNRSEDAEISEMAKWRKLFSNSTAAKEAGLPTLTATQRAYLEAAASHQRLDFKG